MTKENWGNCLKDQCFWPDSPVCMPAALDRVSQQASVSGETYIRYEDTYWTQIDSGVNPRATRRSFQDVLFDIAGTQRLKSVGLRRSTQPDKTTRILQNARMGGFRVLIYTQEGHVVGIMPHETGGWTIEDSTQPIDLDPLVYNSAEIHEILYKGTHADRKGGKWKGRRQSNILLFPPEPKALIMQSLEEGSIGRNLTSMVYSYSGDVSNEDVIPDLSQATVSI